MKVRLSTALSVTLLACAVSFWWGRKVPSKWDIQWQFSEAARWGNVQSLERLHAAGAEIEKQPSDADEFVWGMSALHSASACGNAEAVKWLLRRGADPNRTEATEAPLDLARSRLHSAQQTVDVLLEHGAKTYLEISGERAERRR